jgi:hypothetical protein
MVILIVVAALMFALGLRAAWKFIFLPVDRHFIPPLTWIDEISANRHSILLTLLDERSFQRLIDQPGYTPELVAQFRAQRYRMFVASLRSLREDFVRTSMMLKFVLVHSEIDRPDLSANLLDAQWNFAKGFAIARLRAFAWKLGYGTVDIRDLISAVDGLRAALQSCGLRPAESAV